MREEKQLLLDEISNKLNQSKSFVLTRYSKLSGTAAHDFRTLLVKAGADFEVVRKRVFLKAVEPTGIPLSMEQLTGHIGVIFVNEDLIEITKSVFQYGSENENVVEVVGGYYEGRLYHAQDMEKLSKLPSMDEMRAQFSALAPSVVTAPDRLAALRLVAQRLLQELREDQ
jgi:large subunit ribosomal protein L10